MADDRAAIDIAELVARHHAAVYAYAYRLTGAEADADLRIKERTAARDLDRHGSQQQHR